MPTRSVEINPNVLSWDDTRVALARIDRRFLKHNLSATADPAVTDDSGDGYSVGSIWINTTGNSIWMLETSTVGAANWIKLAPESGSAPLNAKYIVQEAHADLSAEQSLGLLTTGLLKNTVTAAVGVLSTAVVGVDYGLGDVLGPASSTDNSICRFDNPAGTTPKTIQNGATLAANCTTIDDNGHILVPNNRQIRFRDTACLISSISSGDMDIQSDDTLLLSTNSLQVQDTGNRVVLDVPRTALAVNYLSITNSATGTALPVTAVGTDTDININMVPKGTGKLQSGGTNVALVSDTLAVFAATTSAQLAGVISDETGTGALVFANTPTLVTPILGTPTSGTLTNCTGLPIVAGTTGTLTVARGGTGVTTISALSIWVANSADTITQVTPGAGNSIRINAGGTAWEAYTPGAGVPTTITVADTTDSTCFVGLFESATGDLAPKTDGGILYDASNGTLQVTTLTLTNDLTVANGGTGASTLTGILEGNGTSAVTAVDSSTVGQVLRCTGSSTFAFGAVDLADSDAVTGLLPLANMETSGKVIARIIRAMPPATSYAQETTIAGTSTPAENIPVFAFDDSVSEYMDYLCELSPEYQGGGLTVRILWASVDHDEATPHIVRWEIGIRRLEDDAEDLDTTSFDYSTNGFTNNAVSATVASVSTEAVYDNITISNGTNMDSVAAGECFIMRIRRNASPASGTDATGDAYLISLSIRET